MVCADVVKQSDDLQTLSSLNNLQQICCPPDVKQRFGHDARSKMQINLVSICCSLLRSDWIQLRHLSAKMLGQLFHRWRFPAFSVSHKLNSMSGFCKDFSVSLAYTVCSVIWLHKRECLIL